MIDVIHTIHTWRGAVLAIQSRDGDPQKSLAELRDANKELIAWCDTGASTISPRVLLWLRNHLGEEDLTPDRRRAVLDFARDAWQVVNRIEAVIDAGGVAEKIRTSGAAETRAAETADALRKVLAETPRQAEPSVEDALEHRLDLAEHAMSVAQKPVFRSLRDLKPHTVGELAGRRRSDDAAKRMLQRIETKLLEDQELALELEISGSSVLLKDNRRN